jgi:hypothetical protein
MLLSDKNFKSEINHLEIYNQEFFQEFYSKLKTFLKQKKLCHLETIFPTRIIMKTYRPFMYDENLYCPCYEIYYKNIHILTLKADVHKFNTYYHYDIHHSYKGSKLYQLCDYTEMEKIFEEKKLCDDIIHHIFSFL